ncbi:hypothetical protein CSOJ01_05661 [Colletotrichum sojae]|uniref:Uncharacterized protein n=1 Tax=Colletotrichum sojae TaxID=2175907 RepID=A0A8H6JEL3_9PEZI|nr:hypothetical protein CSOJ01_05661 [Colletotrichum sojae]
MDRLDNKFDIRRKLVADTRKSSAPATSKTANPETTPAPPQTRDTSGLDELAATSTSLSRSPENGANGPRLQRQPSRDGLLPPGQDSLRRSVSTQSTQPFTVSAPTSGRSTPSHVTLFEEDSSTRSRSASTTGRSAWSTTPSTKVPDDAGPQTGEPRQPGRISQYFSRTFLVGIAMTFVIMILALEILNMFSQRNKGIVAVDEKNHYLWTYGPTFILTLFVAIMGQFEHRAKHTMPWLAMANGPAEAEEGFLLDYITPFTIVSLYRSAQKKHFLVTLSILSTLTLRLLVIVSTGLLSVSREIFTREVNVTTTDAFNMTGSVNRFAIDNGLTLWGMSQSQIPLPPGTTNELLSQSFVLPDQGAIQAPGDTLSASVVVFETELYGCHNFSWYYPVPWPSGLNIRPDAATTEERAILRPWCLHTDLEGLRSNMSLDGNMLPVAFRVIGPLYKCGHKLDTDDADAEENPWGLSVGMPFQTADNKTGLTGLLCHLKYSLARRKVTTLLTPNQMGSIVSVDSEVLETLPIGLPVRNITVLVRESLGSLVARLRTPDDRLSLVDQQTVMTQLMNFTDPQPTERDLADLARFPELAMSVYKKAALQAIKSRQMKGVNSTVPGLVTYTVTRLVVEKVSLRIMESLLALLAVICLAFMAFPFASLPTSSGFMLTLASILARSPNLGRVLDGTGSINKYAFKKRLSFFLYYVIPGNAPSDVRVGIQPKRGRIYRRTRGGIKAAQRTEWWFPMAAGIPYKTALVGFTIGIIVSLEVLLQLSIKDDGLGSVSEEGYTKYAWLFLPALIMGGFALAYSTVDVTYRMLHPFQRLHQAASPNLQDLKYDPSGKLTLTAVIRALKRRHFALAAAMFTSLLGPILTIAVSGLFSTTYVPEKHDVSLRLESWFDVSSASGNRTLAVSYNSRVAAVDMVFGQAILYNNLSYPQWTHEGLVFPRMRIAASDFDLASAAPPAGSGQRTKLVVRVPAVRSRMNCTSHYFSTNQDFTLNNAGRQVAIPFDPPAGCSAPPRRPTNITRPFDVDRSRLWLGIGRPLDGPWGHEPNRFWSRGEDWPADANDTLDRWDSPYEVCGDGRQHLFFAYGHQTGNVTDHARVMHCMPHVETVSVDATLVLPDMEISQTKAEAPRADESSARPWGPAGNYSSLPDPRPKGRKDYVSNVGGLFESLCFGRDGVPIEDLVQPEQLDRLTQRMESVYQGLTAQSLNINCRTDVADGKPLENGFVPVVNGTIYDGSRLRLIQSPVSTRILEVLFLSMLLCACVVFLLSGPARILPKNPGSIARRMSLLADSTILNYMTDYSGASSSSASFKEEKGSSVVENEIGQDEFFDGDVFSLGWWHTGEGKSRYGVDLGLADNDSR